MDRKYVDIIYLPKTANWLGSIQTQLRNSSSASLRKKWERWDKWKGKEGSLSEMGLALTTKTEIIGQAIDFTKKIIEEFDEQIIIDDLEKYSESDLAYSFPDKQIPYKVLFYLETLIFELRSTYEIVGKFIKLFFECILDKQINEKDIGDYLSLKGLDLAWIKDLANARKLFFHNNAPWVAIHIKSIEPFSCEPIILKHNLGSLDYPGEFIYFEKIIIMTDSLIYSMKVIWQWITEQIEEYEIQES